MMEAPTLEFSSASRQKSCHACVKGKRGCDKRHPVCSRCQEKKIQCIYAKRTYAQAFLDFDSTELDMSWAEFTALSSSIGFVDDIPPSLAPSASQDPTCLPTPNVFIDPSSTFTESLTASPNDMQLISNFGESLDQEEDKEQALNKFDYAPMADLCVCDTFMKLCHY
jgi:hypothetical protein